MRLSKKAVEMMLNTGDIMVYTNDKTSFRMYENMHGELTLDSLYHDNKFFSNTLRTKSEIINNLSRHNKKYQSIEIRKNISILVLA